MSIQVQGRVQSLYNVYAANEAFSAVQAQDRSQPETPRKDAVVLSEEGRTFGEILNRLKAFMQGASPQAITMSQAAT